MENSTHTNTHHTSQILYDEILFHLIVQSLADHWHMLVVNIRPLKSYFKLGAYHVPVQRTFYRYIHFLSNYSFHITAGCHYTLSAWSPFLFIATRSHSWIFFSCILFLSFFFREVFIESDWERMCANFSHEAYRNVSYYLFQISLNTAEYYYRLSCCNLTFFACMCSLKIAFHETKELRKIRMISSCRHCWND